MKNFHLGISQIRHNELVGVRRILFIKAANQAIAFSVPALASVLAFVTYALLGKPLDPAVIFTSLSLFSLLRQPLMFLPRALSAWTDARNALGRLTPLFLAETLDSATEIDYDLKAAISIQNATFEWETTAPPDSNQKRNGKKRTAEPKYDTKAQTAKPFSLKNVNLTIPRGQLCAITGAVGVGKSSLLSGLLGDMKKTSGEVKFGGRVGYCAQSAWIQNASLRDNVVFGAEWDEGRYWDAIQNSSLTSDLEMLPDGDLTEIGEKGINLSGGQKQRVNIARALYNDADIVIMDDPLSAVDAHVGKALFSNVIMKGLRDRGKTVLLVTHALHFLHEVDYIYNIVDGRIDEQGTYNELVNGDGSFARLLKEHSGKASEGQNAPQELDRLPETTVEEVRLKMDQNAISKLAGTGKIEGRLIKAEKRNTGAIANKVYSTYISSGRGYWTMPLILLSAALMQGASTVNTYWLIWWQNDQFHETPGFYMGLYAALGLLNAVFTFTLGGSMAVLSFYACETLHRQAVEKIFHAPMAFFDTTPLGRILGVFGKDVDIIDNQLADSLRMLAMTLAFALGSVIIITYIQHYFIIAVAVVIFGYWHFAAYYSNSARELKRIDGNLRSLLYSHFSESLSGLSTIRAYGMTNKFVRDNEYFTDLEDRALLLTTTNQRWLAIRLDFLGAIMIFVVAVLAATGVNGISPAQIGLVLVYCVSLTQLFAMTTRQTAEVENYMNAVERIVHYTRDDLIEQEAPYEIEQRKPPPDWPTTGNLELRNIVMNYRPGLPPVLKGISLSVRDGEKIGVVGRTGAGKSSLMIALYRIVELASGSIWLDGVDISTIGLRDLRSKISIIPQDPLLFSGTIRTNLDPFSQFEDSKLWDSLRRAHLVETVPKREEIEKHKADRSSASQFNLDTPIEPEGANLSVGQRSLLSLARALVRDEIRLVLLDEATASVDVETDSAIQETITREFAHKTLLCIAHRLRTIIHYDRVLVLEAGQVAEFGTPLELFQQGGIFRHLCEQSKITETDIMPNLSP
ncbi:hypothetical protein FRC02_005189 [Tulasnella sp. 418]|nr:hypothetical protein FRC02_005189 [Tulasnella sp. 418]